MTLFSRFKNQLQQHFKLPDLGIMVFFGGITLFSRFWLLPHLSTQVFRGIPNIYTWMALWNCRVLSALDFSMYWTGNAMYPYANAFAFSENMMGYTPLVCPLWKITGNPVFTINLLSLLLIWLTAVITYYMLKSFNLSRFASLTGALLFAFYPWVLKMSSLGRFHMQGLMWLPIILLANCKFWHTGKKKYLFLLSFFWLWTFLISLYLGIFLAVFLGIWNITWFLYEGKLFPLKKVALWCVSVLLVWIIMAPIFLVYHRVSTDMGVERSLENQVKYTGPVWSWVTTPDENWLWGQTLRFLPRGTRDGIIENFIFPGFICFALFLAAFFFRQVPLWLKSLKWTALSLIVLGAGPYLLGLPWKIPMPFILLWNIFPPMKATRNPHRLALFAVLGIAVLAAYVINHLEIRKKLPLVFKILLISAILVESFTVEKTLPAIKASTPLIYQKIKAADPLHTVIELPMSTATNLKALTFSAFHWNRIINGSSNYWPPLLEQLERELKNFPSDHTMQLLQALSVDRIILHEYLYPGREQMEMNNRLKQRPELGFIERVAGYSLWSLEKGKPFLPFNPYRHLEVSGPSRWVSGRSAIILSLDVPPAKDQVVFNPRAPFYSQFLASKKWYITPVSPLTGKTGNIQEPIPWMSPALFHRYNWRKPVPVKIVPGTGNIEIIIDMMGDPIRLSPKTIMVEAEKPDSAIPAYFSLPKGFKEIPEDQLKVKLTPFWQPIRKGNRQWQLEGYVEVSNPGPYYWSAQPDSGVYLGIIMGAGNQPEVFSYLLPHDLFPGDKTALYVSVPLVKDTSSHPIFINCFGRSKPGEFKWFPGNFLLKPGEMCVIIKAGDEK